MSNIIRKAFMVDTRAPREAPSAQAQENMRNRSEPVSTGSVSDYQDPNRWAIWRSPWAWAGAAGLVGAMAYMRKARF